MSLREKAKKQMENRSREAYDSRESTGMYENIFNKGKGGKFWKCVNGDHSINILIWAAGENYPTVSPYDKIKPGDIVYFLDIWVHKGVGPNEATVVCPAKNYNKPCPICEHVAELRREDADKDTINEIKAKRRTVYNIEVLDSDEEQRKGVQIWDVAHFFMQQHLAGRAKSKKTGKFIHFADPDTGKEVYFERSGDKTSTSFSNHTFEERDGYVVSDDLLNKCKCLDDMLTIYDYETLKKMHWGEDAEEGEEDDIPMDPGEEKEEKEEKEEEATTRRPRSKEKKEKKVDNECSQGMVFGVDADADPKCDDCPQEVWDACNKEKEKIKAEKKPTGRRRRG